MNKVIATPCATKQTVHRHGDNGPFHLTFEIMLDPRAEDFIKKILDGFHDMMQKISGMPPIEELHYEGEEAAMRSSTTIDEYFNQNPYQSNDRGSKDWN